MPRHSVATRELRSIRDSFAQLARSFGRLEPLLAASGSPKAAHETAGETRPRRRPRISAQQRQALKLQGKYMGTMRGLRPRQRAQVKKIRAKKGIRAAIAEARRLGR
jgi:hypothetical protein